MYFNFWKLKVEYFHNFHWHDEILHIYMEPFIYTFTIQFPVVKTRLNFLTLLELEQLLWVQNRSFIEFQIHIQSKNNANEIQRLDCLPSPQPEKFPQYWRRQTFKLVVPLTQGSYWNVYQDILFRVVW